MAYERAQSIHDLWRVSGPEAAEPVPPARFPSSSTRSESLPEYSPDGSRIAFSSDRYGGLEVWVSDADGRKLQVLTDKGHVKLGGWSPNGDRIAFGSFSADRESFDIFVVNSAGGTSVNLTPDEFWDYAPSWTLDGRWIYYASEREGQIQICRILAEGGPAEQVTEKGGDVPKVVGNNELFFWREDGIWSLTLEELEETLVLGKDLHFFEWNVWKEQIVYLDEVEDIPLIEKFNPKSGETERLHTFEKGTNLGLGVAVSPDGQWILYTQVENKSDFMLVENFY
jgi:Tol biopolymer transport system component